MSKRASYYQLNRPASDALISVGKHFGSIDPKLRALVELRVSQINGCAFCIHRHVAEARQYGETQERLDLLSVWWEFEYFDPAEKAALRWAETLTNIARDHAPDDVYAALEPHFSAQQIVDLTLIIATMNAWNRIAIGHQTHPPRR